MNDKERQETAYKDPFIQKLAIRLWEAKHDPELKREYMLHLMRMNEAKENGRREETFRITKRLRLMKMSDSDICRATELSPEDLSTLEAESNAEVSENFDLFAWVFSREAEAKRDGILEAKINTARRLRAMGMSDSDILKATELSSEDLNTLNAKEL